MEGIIVIDHNDSGSIGAYRPAKGKVVTNYVRENVTIRIEGKPVFDSKHYSLFRDREGNSFESAEDVCNFVSVFFGNASGDGGVPTLDPNNFIVGGEEGNEFRRLQASDWGFNPPVDGILLAAYLPEKENDEDKMSFLEARHTNAVGGTVALRAPETGIVKVGNPEGGKDAVNVNYLNEMFVTITQAEYDLLDPPVPGVTYDII